MERIKPAQAGIRSSNIAEFFGRLEKYELNMHSVLMARGGRLFCEEYWSPYNAETPHRLYSVTKSFVSICIGGLIASGKLNLDDRLIDFFPDKMPAHVSDNIKIMTIRQTLSMTTCCLNGVFWLDPSSKAPDDRLKHYFNYPMPRPAGTSFLYDSDAPYALGCLVERLSGMPLLDYMKKLCLDKLGDFEDAALLECNDGTPWGDSGLIVRPRGLLKFAQLVMNKGVWNGERLLNEEYLNAATSKQVHNDHERKMNYKAHGYGYQIWITENGAFSFNGLGGQFAICVPQKDLVLVATADNQLRALEHNLTLFDAFFECIVKNISDSPVYDDRQYISPARELLTAQGEPYSRFADDINGAWFVCNDNAMGISRFKLDFSGCVGVFTYVNAQGEKRLPFGMKKNVFAKFPQLGYSDNRGGVHDITGFMYDCATSAGWVEPQKLQIYTHIIDKYLGQMCITLCFQDAHVACGIFNSAAEDFLLEYRGWLFAQRDVLKHLYSPHARK